MKALGWMLGGVLVALLVINYFTHAKSTEHTKRQGCMDEDVTTPSFIVVKVCGREVGLTGPHIDVLEAARKTAIMGIRDYPDRPDCIQLRMSGGKILVYGTVERMLMRLQPDFIDWGSCGPTVIDFVKELEGKR